MLANGQNIVHQDVLADAFPNRTFDDQVLLLQETFQFQRAGATSLGSEKTKTAFKAAEGAESSAGTAFTLDYEKTKTAFTAAKGSASNLPSEAVLKQYVGEAGIADAKEFSFFIANMMQESGLLKVTKEASKHYKTTDYDYGEGTGCPTSCPTSDNVDEGTSCCESQESCSKCTNHYIGRGYLQTTWRKNYVDARDNGKCNTDKDGKAVDIVKNPELVETDQTLAWCTSAFFWKKNVHDDRCSSTCDMGNTISAINGDQECKTGSKFTDAHAEAAQNRWCYFASFYDSYSDGKSWPDDDDTCINNLDEKRVANEATCW